MELAINIDYSTRLDSPERSKTRRLLAKARAGLHLRLRSARNSPTMRAALTSYYRTAGPTYRNFCARLPVFTSVVKMLPFGSTAKLCTQ